MAILGVTWGMIIFVGEAWGVLGPGGDRNSNRGEESLDEFGV